MADKTYQVYWTEEAKRQVDDIIDFLNRRWTIKEVSDFLDLLSHFENLISHFPKTYKESKVFKKCRLGLVHRHVTAIYTVKGKQITILTVIDNRQNKEK